MSVVLRYLPNGAGVVLPLPLEATEAEHSTLAVFDSEPGASTATTAGLTDEQPTWQPQQHNFFAQYRHLRPGGPFKARTIFGAKQHVALHHAVRERNPASVRHLLEYLDSWTASQPGPDAKSAAQSLINSFNGHHMTPLMLACRLGASEATRLLLEHGADPLIGDRAGNNSLHLAARAGHVGCIQELLAWQDRQPQQQPGRRIVNSGNGCHYTALHHAVWAGCHEGAELLLAAGASLTARNTMEGWDLFTAGSANTPLHLAAHRGCASMSTTLLRAYLFRGDRARRIPDPRLLPNGAGHKPYEVAQLRGQPQLLAVLHPTVEWQQLFGEDADVAYLFSPASLAEMAAAQLRWKLLGQLEQIQSASAQLPSPRLTRTLSIPLRHHPSGELPAPLSVPCCDPSTPPTATAHAHAHPLNTPPHSSSADSRLRCGPQCSEACSHPCPSTASSQPRPSLPAAGLPEPTTEGEPCSSLQISSGGSSSAIASQAAAGGQPQAQQACEAGGAVREEPCGICWEAGKQLVQLQPCNHFACVACMKRLLDIVKLGAAPTCPFCRGLVGSLE